jgi:FAD/FMN-containing dehydrogenase
MNERNAVRGRGMPAFRGRMIGPGDAGYDQARQGWNLAIDRRPELICRCVDAGDVVSALAMARTAGLPATSPLSAVLLIPMGGAIARVPAGATAVGHRDAAYCLEAGASWPPGDEAVPRHRDWADRIWAATAPWSAGNEINHQIDDSPAGVLASYGEQTYARLADLKRRWDPQNVFRLNHNIIPAPHPNQQ